MGMKTDPLIFLHIGDIFYLKYTLKSAVHHNPNTPVILIGDHYNKKYERLGVKHFNFHDYLDSDDVKEFYKVYKLIGGTRFIEINESKGYDWTKYNFLKWFAIRNFLQKNNYSSCWTFDSDNIILCDLNSKNYFFEHLDCTARPNFSMIIGKINSIRVLDHYCSHIIELFKDESFLKAQAKDFIITPAYGFTMMRAFMDFYKKHKTVYKIDSYQREHQNTIFLDVLLLNKDNKFELEPELCNHREIKKLYSNSGKLFVRKKDENTFINLNSVDLSWVPEYYFKKIISLSINKRRKHFNTPQPISIKKTLDYTIRNLFYKLRKKIYLKRPDFAS